MNNFLKKFAAILIFLAGIATAQPSGTVRIYTVPDGLLFSVDGQQYHGSATAVWPAGSKHQLSTQVGQVGIGKTQYAFESWQYSGGVLPGGGTVTVSADPSLKEFFATFNVQQALSLNFADCSSQILPCSSPGTVYVNNAPYTSNADIYFPAGAVVKVLAVPGPGYVFTGYDVVDNNQVATGFVNTVTMNVPTVVRPHFELARRVNLQTVPPELDVFSDRIRVPTPSTFEWAYGSLHTIGAPSPQQSKTGAFYVFTGWSDGGALNHAYTVGPGSDAATLVATFVPASVTDIRSVPAGLPLKVDGRDNWPTYLFAWAVGETHHLEAPLQQIDDKGRLYAFNSWSNGGSRVQDYLVPARASSDVSLTATYTPVGHLVVSSAIAGLSVKVDGADCITPCDVQRPVGTAVRVSAPASIAQGDNVRVDFDGWPGSGSAAGDWTVTLAADPVRPYLTYHTMNRLVAASDPVDGASWRMQPATADGFYDTNATVVVSVTPQPGFRFRRWSGDASGSAPNTSVPMNTPRLVEAMFDRVPYIAPTGVGNGAGSTPQNGVAAGSIVSIYGASFAPNVVMGPDAPLAQALDCVTVRMGDRILPLFFVSPSQINLQLPDDTSAGDQRLTVSCQGAPDVQTAFTVLRNAPGLFQDGQSVAIAVHEDGSAVTADAPAKRGELLTMYGTGFGPADHGRPFGFPVPIDAVYSVVDGVTVRAGDASIAAENAVAAPGRIAVDAVRFRLGDGVSAGLISVRVTVNGNDSNTVVLPVQ